MNTKPTITGQVAPAGLKAIAVITFSLITLQACQKAERVTPNKIDKSAISLSALSEPSASSLYEVSTFFQGYPALDNLFRLCKSADNTLYATSAATNKVYKISTTAVVSDLTTFPAGSNLIGVKAGAEGSVYVAVYNANQIVKVDRLGHKTPVPVSIGLNKPSDVAIGPDSTLYIADEGNNRIVKVTKSGVATILAGKTGIKGTADGKGGNARFVRITNIRFAADNNVYVLDADPLSNISGKSLRKITSDGTVSTFFKVTKIGNQTSIIDFAPAKKDKNFDPVMKENFFLITTNFRNDGVIEYKISHLSSGKIETTIVPYNHGEYKDGPADEAVLAAPSGIAIVYNGIYLTDANSAIRKVSRKL
ncbi:hypothetical protein IDJ77_14840 [Mucilaginibacter sp. ZT4R22]|uniref:DNA-binding beta-propeller fold protein YncE n=1 Tax=Mucilaginibacter pankratovii TaxID=2772110 RepID=A0ABR7WS14_9SPHI|nr:hypothetical protein [Mucilaginibacter pankratovii]MBD1365096.1 hypothetical protein [Mucilaginibacter pankratovii]